jgi:hypothetical protein
MSRCEKSPTEAHHWILNSLGGSDTLIEGTCKYCGRERTFHHPHPYDRFTARAIHRNVVKPKEMLVDPYTGEDYE